MSGRVIKFRAWVVFGGLDPIRPYMNYNPEFNGDISDIFSRNGKGPSHKYGAKIIYMQFTGVYDKNGVEIYENDIVIINGHQYKIKFEIGSFMLIRCSGETDMYEQFKECWNDDVYPISQYYWDEDSEEDAIHSLEVIGNSFENPELIGGTE